MPMTCSAMLAVMLAMTPIAVAAATKSDLRFGTTTPTTVRPALSVLHDLPVGAYRGVRRRFRIDRPGVHRNYISAGRDMVISTHVVTVPSGATSRHRTARRRCAVRSLPLTIRPGRVTHLSASAPRGDGSAAPVEQLRDHRHAAPAGISWLSTAGLKRVSRRIRVGRKKSGASGNTITWFVAPGTSPSWMAPR